MSHKKVWLVVALNAVLLSCDSSSTSIVADNNTASNADAGANISTDSGSSAVVGSDNSADAGSTSGVISDSSSDDNSIAAPDNNTVIDNNTDAGSDADSVVAFADNPMDLVGLLKLEANSTETDFSRLLLGRLDRSLTAAEIEQWYAPSTDVCEVNVVDNSGNSTVPDFYVFDQQLALISGGENVILSSDAGTYATLSRANGESPFYKTDVALLGDAPANLSLDIPGDEFPAFSNVEIGNVTEFQINNPLEGQIVTPNTDFNWVANNVPRSVVEIYVGGTGINNQPIEIGCTIVDDGSFNFPAAVRAEMGDDFTSDWSAYLRIIYKVAQNGNAIVFTANSIDPR